VTYELPAEPFTTLDHEAKLAELEKISRALYAAHRELPEVKDQLAYYYFEAWKNSAATSVSGRDREAEGATRAIKKDELDLFAQIDSLSTIRDFLVTLIGK
jgi:hypothetical protein